MQYSRSFRFSYVPKKFRPTALTGKAYLKSMCDIDGFKKNMSSQKIEKLAENFFLEDMLDVSMKNLSKGTLAEGWILKGIYDEKKQYGEI